MMILCLLALSALLLAAPGANAAPLTAMPPYPTDPKEYRDKWDPFALPTPTGVAETMPLSNGRQIARDSSGTWFVLVEKERQALFLGVARGERVAGGNLEMVELVGPSPQAVFRSEGDVTGGSLVIDGEDRLHVVWCAGGALTHAARPIKGTDARSLADQDAWGEARRIAEPPCHPGDVLLTPGGEVALCWSTGDTVYYLPSLGAKPEPAGGLGAGMPPLAQPNPAGSAAGKTRDPAAPQAETTRRPSYPPPRPVVERECRGAVADIARDGSVYLAFERDFDIWVARRMPGGRWEPPERAAWGLAFRPAIVAAGERPLVCFRFEGVKKATLGGEDYLEKREGGGSSIGYAVRAEQGWRTGYVAQAEEIIANRQGIWDKRFQGKLVPIVEEMGPPVLFRDRHDVPWVLWQNTTRRWAYCARWMGAEFGEVQECRGPFNGPGAPVSAEKVAPAGAPDMGMLFLAGGRILFDRLRIPTLSLADAREVLFLDSQEVAETAGVEFVLNRMGKHPANPVLSPGPVGSKDDRHVFSGVVRRHGETRVMRYGYQSWDDADWKSGALAVSADGVRWQKVEKLPEGLPPAQGDGKPQDPLGRGYFDNPDTSDPARRFWRITSFGPGWVQGSKRVQYSPDGQRWTDGPEVSALNALYEGAGPNLWDPLDIAERRIKAYGRVFSVNSRSCGVMWTADGVHWEGAEHFLDPDDPYGKPPGQTSIGPLRGQVFLDACAGKGEDQIYSASVRIVEGLYLCVYWPCTFDHRYDGALAVSRDGLNFTRVKNGGRTLPCGPAGAWDSGMVKMGWPQRDGDVMRDYYGGSAWHHGVEPYRPAWHIGLATLRANGWTYYTPRAEVYEGSVTTIAIDAPAGARRGLAVNVEGAGRRGAFTVEVLDAATGAPVKGYAVGDCRPLKADGVAAPVTWKAGAALPTGRPIRLRFHLRGRGVRLYSFGFRADPRWVPTGR